RPRREVSAQADHRSERYARYAAVQIRGREEEIQRRELIHPGAYAVREARGLRNRRKKRNRRKVSWSVSVFSVCSVFSVTLFALTSSTYRSSYPTPAPGIPNCPKSLR